MFTPSVQNSFVSWEKKKMQKAHSNGIRSSGTAKTIKRCRRSPPTRVRERRSVQRRFTGSLLDDAACCCSTIDTTTLHPVDRRDLHTAAADTYDGAVGQTEVHQSATTACPPVLACHSHAAGECNQPAIAAGARCTDAPARQRMNNGWRILLRSAVGRVHYTLYIHIRGNVSDMRHRPATSYSVVLHIYSPPLN